MTILLLARHGETADNARQIFQGQAGSGLNRFGRAQATRLAQRINRSKPTAIIASDLERAVETARIVSDTCGVPIELDAALREVDVGTWTGKSYREVAELFPEEYAAWQHGLDVRRGGGETYVELAERIDRALAEIARRHADSDARVLVVSHGGSIKSFIATKVLRVSDEGVRGLGGVANAGLTVVEHHPSGWRLHSWNDTAHLEGLAVDEHSD